MTEINQPAFEGFTPSTNRFVVTASHLRVATKWSNEKFGKSTGLSHSISGLAISAQDRVCVIGKEGSATRFDLIILTNEGLKQQWERHERIQTLVENDDGGAETRARNTITKRLIESPPTAFLETDGHGQWQLTCGMPSDVFGCLCGEIDREAIEFLSIKIEWVFGLTRPEFFSFLLGNTWGLFTVPGCDSPEPMYGHLLSLDWIRPPQDHNADRHPITTSEPLPAEFNDAMREWLDALKSETKEEKHSRIRNPLDSIAPAIARSTHDLGEKPPRLRWKLDQLKEFLSRLDHALHQKEGPYAEKDWLLWSHRNLARLYKANTATQREHFVDYDEFANLIVEYVATPWLSHPYLDWLVLDVLTSSKIVGSLETVLKHRHGASYELFNGNKWKMAAWKIIVWPLVFAFSWILPAVGLYYWARDQFWIALASALLYYGFNVFMLARWLGVRLLWIVTGKPTPRRRALELIEETERTYAMLAGSFLHIGKVRAAFDRAEAKGVGFDQACWYILDRIAMRDPFLWRTEPYIDS